MVVNITNVKNILYVPNAGDAFSNLRVEAVKLGNQLVGQSEIDVKYMVSDDPYDIDELSAARNVTKSADFTGV